MRDDAEGVRGSVQKNTDALVQLVGALGAGGGAAHFSSAADGSVGRFADSLGAFMYETEAAASRYEQADQSAMPRGRPPKPPKDNGRIDYKNRA